MSHDAAFDPGLTPEERALIQEELALLAGLQAFLRRYVPEWRNVTYDEALLELRDSLGEASEEDVAQIVHQMSSLASLSSHTAEREEAVALPDAESPYFGHLRVRQEGRERDVLIGNRTLVGGDIPVPIIDWRHAPISRVFYTYQEGDEYEEEIGGRPVEGELLVHRRVMILGGRLLRIDAPQGTYALRDGRWMRSEEARPTLHGGEGAALRPGTLEAPSLGVSHAAPESPDKHLRAITGLIDPEQFEVITRPESGVVVIDGGAGSGKTTIALHRMAFLAYQDPERFAPERMLAVVFSKALAAYVSHILPALGVQGVRIEVFEDFVSALRRQHYPSLNAEYNEYTPTTAMRFKQHPAVYAYLQDYLAGHAAQTRADIAAAVAGTADADAVLAAWDALDGQPLVQRMAQFAAWVQGRQALAGVGRFAVDWLTAQRVRQLVTDDWPELTHPHEYLLALWEDAFARLEPLRAGMERHAPGEFSDAHLSEVRDRALEHAGQAAEYRAWQEERKAGGVTAEEPEAGADGEPAATQPELPRMDREDDTLLLHLHRLALAPLRSRRKRPLRFQHVTVDEAQDLSPLELRVLLELAAEPRSVTLAGDTDQRMILHNAFTRWEDVLGHLDLESTAISPLRVGYRSTAEIMGFARHVLGPLATERPWHAVRSGAPVELLRFTDAGQAVAMLAEALRGLMRREPTASVALIARYASQADVYHEGLTRAELPALRRVAEQDFAFRPGVDVTDIGQVKGLEFDYVVLLDVDRGSYPDDTASRYLLHIGATRAAHQLWLVACRAPSPLLPSDLETHLL